MEEKELKRLILDAFSTVKYPGDYNIAYKHPTGGDTSDEGRIELFLRGQRWNELSWTQVNNKIGVPIQSVLNFMSLAARAYYLPFFLVACLEHNDASDAMFIFICLNLNNDSTNLLFSALSEKQRYAFFKWLLFMIQRENIDKTDPEHPALELFHILSSNNNWP